MNDYSAEHSLHLAKDAAAIRILLGIWYFVSPWVFGFYMDASAWSFWVAGVLIVLFSTPRQSEHARVLAWFSRLMGAWVFASPWIFQFTADERRLVNCLCVGALVFLLSLGSLGVASTGPMVAR
jgi:hypothetical protein